MVCPAFFKFEWASTVCEHVQHGRNVKNATTVGLFAESLALRNFALNGNCSLLFIWVKGAMMWVGRHLQNFHGKHSGAAVRESVNWKLIRKSISQVELIAAVRMQSQQQGNGRVTTLCLDIARDYALPYVLQIENISLSGKRESVMCYFRPAVFA